MQKLSKSEFMHLVVNDLYEKNLIKRKQLKDADAHIINNINKIRDFNGRKRR